MSTPPTIAVLRFTPGSTAESALGLLGLVLVRCGALVIDGVAVRKTRGGRGFLAFPVHHDRGGGQHHVVRPVDGAARRAIEDAVLARLGLAREATP